MEDLKKMAEGMDIQGGVTAFKSSLQVFEHSLLHFEEVIEEANLPGVSRTIAQTAQVFQQNFTIITVTIILVAIAYTLRTEPEPRWFLVVCFNTPAAGISIKGVFSTSKSGGGRIDAHFRLEQADRRRFMLSS